MTGAERQAERDNEQIYEAFLDAQNNGGDFHNFLVEKFGVDERVDEFNSGVTFGPNYYRWNETATNSERYATLANLFYQFPDDLQGANPELYELMVRRTGVDPLG